jgi:hypothetical protein
MDVLEQYERYNKIYQIKLREVAIPYHLQLMKEIDMLEKLTIDEFKERLDNIEFKKKYGTLNV